jgi:hypothetical protein
MERECKQEEVNKGNLNYTLNNQAFLENWSPPDLLAALVANPSTPFPAQTSNQPKRRALTSLRPHPKAKRIKIEEE